MINSKLADAINRQINAEFHSAFLYLSMANYLESKGLGGMAGWLAAHFEEESRHATKLVNYMHERGGRVLLAVIDAPQTEWDSPQAVFQDALKHEILITGKINELMDLALKESEHATSSFLRWFVDEQVEEEATFQEINDKFELGANHPGFLYMLDKEMGQRQPTLLVDQDASQ